VLFGKKWGIEAHGLDPFDDPSSTYYLERGRGIDPLCLSAPRRGWVGPSVPRGERSSFYRASGLHTDTIFRETLESNIEGDGVTPGGAGTKASAPPVREREEM